MKNSKKALQIVAGLLTLVPLLSGIRGLVSGIGDISSSSGIDLETLASMDSQGRFLSIIWLGYAAIAWWIIPNIEKQTTIFRILFTLPTNTYRCN